MINRITGKDVLSDIQFELLQGSIAQNDLGKSITRVKRYQHKIHDELIQQSKEPEIHWPETVSRLLQVNDMLLTLLQETASSLQAMRLEIAQLARLTTTSPDSTFQKNPSIQTAVTPSVSSHEWHTPSDLMSEIEESMSSDALDVELETQPSFIPVVGSLLSRFRVMLHNLVLFYIGKLAKKQAQVNLAYGNWILDAAQGQQEQQLQIDHLNAQVASLQAQLSQRE
jgi:hypothetical protein